MSLPFLYSGGSTTGLSATGARWPLPVILTTYAKVGAIASRAMAVAPRRPEITYSILAALPLHRDARGIANLDPDRARPRAIRAVDLLRDDASAPRRHACSNTIGPSSARGTEPAC